MNLDLKSNFIAAARGYLNTPWKHQGRLKHDGVDCIGLIYNAATEVGIKIAPGRLDYREYPDGKELIAELEARMVKVETSRFLVGDVVVFWFETENLPQHIGIITDIGVIHTNSDIGKVVEHRLSPYWIHRIHSMYRFRELE